jgi:hypothetical protein
MTLAFVFLAACFLGHLEYLAFLELPVPFRNTRFLQSIFASVSRANVLLVLLPVFTQNLMFIHCSRFLALIFPPTVYHEVVLLPLMLEKE